MKTINLATRRILAAVVSLVTILLGGPSLLALGAGGLLGAFAYESFSIAFLALVVYVAALAIAAGWYAFRPRRAVGWTAAVLSLPAGLFLAHLYLGGGRLRQLAREAAGPDPGARAAREELAGLGQKAGRQPHVEELVRQLRRAEDDESRRRIVDLLGRSSYQNEQALEELTKLLADTRDVEAREELHEAVLASILRINPYDREVQEEALERGLQVPIELRTN